LGFLRRASFGHKQGQPTVHITGAVKQALTLSAEDLAKMPRASVRTTNNGMETVYEGAWVHEVLKRAGCVLRGTSSAAKALAGYVLAESGRTATKLCFSLGELDPSFIDNEILWADTAHGKPCFGAQGPVPTVVPKDKPGARSVRMLTRLESGQLRK